MATSTIPNFESISNAAVLTGMQRRPMLHRPRPSVRTSARKSPQLTEEKQQLLVEMLPTVKRIAFKMREHLPSYVELDDLVANGVLGLVDAISKFDISKRVKLESYARHRIRGAILDGLRSVDPASRDLRRKNKEIRKIYRRLEGTLGRPVQDEEIAAELDLSMARWHQTLNDIQTVGFNSDARNISAGPSAKRVTPEPAMLAGDEADPFDLCYRNEQRAVLRRALLHLRERERQVIAFYYDQEMAMKQIAEHMHIDESRVSQIHSSALTRLKVMIATMLDPLGATRPRVKTVLSMAMGAGA